jgi:hypothetical protein
MVDPAHVLYLALIASRLSGYSMPLSRPPAVIELTTAEMSEMACPPVVTSLDPCHEIIGMYRDGDLIWVDIEYEPAHGNKISEDAIIVHELVHWLQKEHAWGGFSCPHAQAREDEAYRVDNRYAREIEHRTNVSYDAPKVCYSSKDFY